MLRETKFIIIILILIGSFSLSSLMAEAAHPIPDISIDYDTAIEVEANQFVHLPGPVEMPNGTSGRNGYGHISMPADLPEQTVLTVSQVDNVDSVTNSNGEGITRCGEVYSFILETPDGTSYSEPASLTLPYCNGLSDLDIYSLDQSADNWTKQNGSHQEGFNDYTTQVASLGTHGVFSTEQFGEDIDDETGEEEDTNETDDETDEDGDTDEIEVDKEENDKCSEDSTEMHITINLDEETDVCQNQKIDIADTLNQIVMPQDLPTNTTLTVIDVSESDIVTKEKGLHRGGDVLEFILKTPEGSQDIENFTLKMPYANGVSVDDIYYYNEKMEEWDEQGAEFDYDDFTLNVELSHLSTYGVFGKDEEEADKKEAIKEDQDDDSSDIAVSVEDDKDKKGSFLPSTATGIFNWILVGVVILIIGLTFFIINRRKSFK